MKQFPTMKELSSGCSRLTLAVALLALLSGCATPAKQQDYRAFKESRPASILVLPPINNSPDVRATQSVMVHTAVPLGEAGYYVFPIAMVEETFKQNGLTSPEDIHEVSTAKLREIFGADAALYMTVTEYGTVYSVVASETVVTVKAKLVDLRQGTELWSGTARASSAEEGSGGSGGGIVGLLVRAAVRQIMETAQDRGHQIAARADYRLLIPGQPTGLLYGPRSPKYQKDGQPAQ